jgi:hypothetical protein
MKFKTWLNLAALAVLVSLTTLVAAPAYAVPTCGSGYICFYDATDGSTLLAKVLASSYARSACYTNSSGKIPAGTSYIVNDPDSSAFVVSTATNCGPTTAPVYANSYGPMNSTFNNRIKSIFRA